jgi:catechol 2,3-dioxygenase-like lactoylglutathione lyase family enzyme
MRPDIWIGHIDLKTSKMAESEAFMTAIGLRLVTKTDRIVIFELRGGTHLILEPGEADDQAGFDFMVEDVAATHKKFGELGLQVSDLDHGRIHDSFFITEPGGNHIKVNSTHVEDHSLV